jgi:hypothetical protein
MTNRIFVDLSAQFVPFTAIRRSLGALAIVLISASSMMAEDLPSDFLVAESFGASMSLALRRPRRSESEGSVSASYCESPASPAATGLAAFQDSAEPLPVPVDSSPRVSKYSTKAEAAA